MSKDGFIRSLSVVAGVAAFSIILFSSIVHLMGEREVIQSKLLSQDDHSAKEKDVYWANKIMDGGYILHFRHASRDKWVDVEMYDALESDVHENGLDESRYAEDDYFAAAVCLNSKGKVQAKAIGEHLSLIGLPISHVASSVSCRARQTADLAFGGHDSLHRVLIHSGPFLEDEAERLDHLVNFYKNLPLENNKNTIVSGHNRVVKCEMFENCKNENLRLEEGGFYVISARDGKLYLEHEFHNYNDFNKVFYER